MLAPGGTRPLHFGDPAAELRAGLGGAVLADGSAWGRLLASGPDFLPLLHRLSTGDVATLERGRGRPTILTTPKGRIVERLFVHRLPDGDVLCVGGQDSGERVADHLRRFTFAEKTGLAIVTAETFQFVFAGPQAALAVAACGVARPAPFGCAGGALADVPVHVLAEDGLSGQGFSIVGPAAAAPEVWEVVASAVERAGGRLAGDGAFEARRVLLGLPAAGHELTGEHNPLEAGQWEAVSFDKGCYVGQEVVARLRTYDKVASRLVGLELPAARALPGVGTRLYDGDAAVGRLTSAVQPPGRPSPVGLGYVKRKALRPGLALRLGLEADAPRARVVDLPFRV